MLPGTVVNPETVNLEMSNPDLGFLSWTPESICLHPFQR
jgi:hypothetical protein